MSRYIVSPEASRDLDEISDYFAARSIAFGFICRVCGFCFGLELGARLPQICTCAIFYR